MRKQLMSLVTITTLASATTDTNPVFSDCNDWHATGCVNTLYLQEFTTLANDATNSLILMREEVRQATELANKAIAGATAIAAIDFGSTAKGKTEVGFGIGVSDSYVGTDYAAGFGAKHGITDTTAVIFKGFSGKKARAGALGITYSF